MEDVAWTVKPANDFKRVAELFGAPESSERRLVLRTAPAERGGRYCIVTIAEAAKLLAPGTKLEVNFIAPDQSEKQTQTFALPPNPPATCKIWLGFTGDAFSPEPMVAWEVKLLGPDGKVLDRRASFLWE